MIQILFYDLRLHNVFTREWTQAYSTPHWFFERLNAKGFVFRASNDSENALLSSVCSFWCSSEASSPYNFPFNSVFFSGEVKRRIQSARSFLCCPWYPAKFFWIPGRFVTQRALGRYFPFCLKVWRQKIY